MKRFEAPTEPTGETPDPYEKRRLPMANRKRNIQMKFYVTEEEKRLIDEKMAQLPTRRYGAYLRKMAIDGYNAAHFRPQVAFIRKALRCPAVEKGWQGKPPERMVTVSSPVFSKNASFVKVVISRNFGTSGQCFSRTDRGMPT